MSDAPKAPRRWVIPVMILSLAINLLIVGIVAGWVLSKDGPRGDRREAGAVRGLIGEPFVRALPSADRRALFEQAMENRDQLRENREALRQRLDDFLAALEAKTFEPERVRALLADQRAAAIRRQEIGEEFLIERLTAMSQDERAAYAANLRERLKGFRQRSERD